MVAAAHAVLILPVMILDLVTLMQLDRLLFRIHLVVSYLAKQPSQFQRIHPTHRSMCRKNEVNGMEKYNEREKKEINCRQ